MYSSNQSDFQKPPPPPSYNSYGEPAAIGIPSTHPPSDQYYSYNNANFNQQPSQFPATAPAPPAGSWSSGLCGCFSDCSNCCVTCWCPCITFGQIANIVDKGSTSCATAGGLYALLALLTGCGCLYSCIYRSKMRQQYNLPEKPCNDCLLHFCCESCSLCQEYRELKHRGFDMSIGWHGNMEKRNGGITMAAPIHQGGMSRY